jgi:hypothetical protein
MAFNTLAKSTAKPQSGGTNKTPEPKKSRSPQLLHLKPNQEQSLRFSATAQTRPRPKFAKKYDHLYSVRKAAKTSMKRQHAFPFTHQAL